MNRSQEIKIPRWLCYPAGGEKFSELCKTRVDHRRRRQLASPRSPTANNGDPLGRVKGRIPDWVHTFAPGTMARYIRLNQLVNTSNNASTGQDDQVGLGGILIFDGSSTISIASTYEWIGDAGGIGDWGVSNNWSPKDGLASVPNANNPNHTATFGSSITEPMTVVTNAAVSVNRIEFNNTSSGYVVAGHGNVNLFATTNPDDPVNPSLVVEGVHRFQTSVNLNASTVVDIASDSSLIFDGALNLSGNTLSKTGAGNVAINNQLTTGGGELVVLEGTISGSGTVGGNVDNGGIIAPGNSPGVLAANFSDSGYGEPATGQVPEPSTAILLLTGVISLYGLARRKTEGILRAKSTDRFGICSMVTYWI